MEQQQDRGSILVVDNERVIRDFLAEVLVPAGYDVAMAYNGAEALRLLDAARCDLVLLDIQMPGIDGWRTLELLRVDHPGLKVVMMSGAVDDVRAGLAGANGVLHKPYYSADILRAVRQQLPEFPDGGDATPSHN